MAMVAHRGLAHGQVGFSTRQPKPKKAASPSGLTGTWFWWEAAGHPASHSAWRRGRSAMPRAILQTSASKPTKGMQGNDKDYQKKDYKKKAQEMIVYANDNFHQSHWRFYFTRCVKMCLCLTLAMVVISEYVSSKTVQRKTIFTLPDGRH